MKPQSTKAGGGRQMGLIAVAAIVSCSVLMSGLLLSGGLLAATVGHQAGAAPSDGIPPLSIEGPTDCPVAFPRSMNDGTFPDSLALIGTIYCDEGASPVSWQRGTWLRYEHLPILRGEGEWGDATSVSDGPLAEAVVTFVVSDFDDETNEAWVSTAGQPPIRLPTHNEEGRAISARVSSDGNHIFGTIENNLGYGVAHWTRNGDGWSLTEDISAGSGSVSALTAEGTTVVGDEQGAAWVWTATVEGGKRVWLLGAAAANDIAHDGSIIVGRREGSGNGVSVAVYWVRDGEGWQLRDLPPPPGLTIHGSVSAVAVAEVDGQSVIVGNVISNPGQYIERAVAWIPGPDGEYGVPTELESVNGSATSVAVVVDVNRNGTAVGRSRDRSADTEWTTVVWQVVEQPQHSIDVGQAGAWYNPETPGQGLMIDVEPSSQAIFLAWFTYTDSAADTPGDQHWYTAQGHYSEATAYLPLYETLGGQLHGPRETATNPVGSVSLSFSDCHRGEFSYEIDVDGRDGTIPLQRLLPGSGAACEQRRTAVPGTQAVNINDGMDGAWIDEDAPGQGFLFDVHTNLDGSNFIFAAWLTFGDGTASGQRWLTAQGTFSGTTGDLPIHETLGGRFDDARNVETRAAGAMHIEFTDCSNALLSYSLDDGDVAGEMAISRLLPGGQALCEEFSASE